MESTVIADRQSADRLLGELRQADLELARLENAQELELSRVRRRYEKRLGDLRARIETGEGQLKSFALEQRSALFGESLRLRLPHGVLGFRRSKRLMVGPDTLARLETHAAGATAIRIIKEVDKTALRKWNDADLALIGAALEQHEEFFCERA